MNQKIKAINAMEILDSRGNPTIRTYVTLNSGITASASVPRVRPPVKTKPSSSETAAGTRYGGKGVLKAVAHLERCAPRFSSTWTRPSRRRSTDHDPLDGTPNRRSWAPTHPERLHGRARAASMPRDCPFMPTWGLRALRLPSR